MKIPVSRWRQRPVFRCPECVARTDTATFVRYMRAHCGFIASLAKYVISTSGPLKARAWHATTTTGGAS
jgi:hypothetical protein